MYTIAHIDLEELKIVVDHVEATSVENAIAVCCDMHDTETLIDPVVFSGHITALN